MPAIAANHFSVPEGHQINMDSLPLPAEPAEVIMKTPGEQYAMTAGHYALLADRIDQPTPSA